MATIYTDLTSLKADLQAHPDKLSANLIDNLAYTAQFGASAGLKEAAQQTLFDYAPRHAVKASSIHELYMAFARGEIKGFSVPALNIRTLTYDTAHMIYGLMMEYAIGPLIFEIAISEQEYTSQTHAEYSSAIIAGAMQAGYEGPVFILGDHYQLKADAFRSSKEAELKRLEEAIRKALAAHFYNIDIDGSTLVHLDLPYKTDQQKDNFEVTAYLTKLIRRLQPEGMTVAVGGEIGHIGGVNSCIDDLRAFMDGYKKLVPDDAPGLAKIAIQTGTSHGGTPNADGSVAPVELEAQLHQEIGDVARSDYGVGGTVQHGASTLPDNDFHIFPKVSAIEVHLATGWQNCIYDAMTSERRQEIYTWISNNLQSENKDGWTNEQFIYKARKKAWGHFKKDMWQMSTDEKAGIMQALKEKATFIFEKLNVYNTRETVRTYIS